MQLPRKLILVRHGESEGNVAAQAIKKYGDYTHMRRLSHVHTEAWRLTKRGAAQAKCAGEYLERLLDTAPLCGYTSPFARALETAALLGLPTQWRIHPMLAERNWGMASSTTEDNREALLPSLELRERDGLWWAPPGGESVAAVTVRLHAFLEGLSRDTDPGLGDPRTVVVVCHGEVMWALRILLERMPPHEYRHLDENPDPAHKINNAQILCYERDPQSKAGYHSRISVCPWSEEDGQIVSRAREYRAVIERPTYTNEGLLHLLEQNYPPLLR